jgi:hypothetical protein
MTDNDDSNDDSSTGWFTARKAFLTMFSLTVLSMVAVQPVMGQATIVCNGGSATQLGELLQRFFQLTTLVGILGVFAIWQGGSLAEIITLSQKQKRNIKQHKSSSLKAAVVLVLIGPLFSVASSGLVGGSMDCLDLTQL